MRGKNVGIAVALVVAILSAFGLANYVGTAESRAESDAELVPVLVAAANIESNVSFGEAWDLGLIVEGRAPAGEAENMVTSPDALAGKVSIQPIFAGSPIVRPMFGSSDEVTGPATFANKIPDGRVAVTFNAGTNDAVADLIRPGDRVNVLISVDDVSELGAGEGPAVLHVFQALEIVAIGQVAAADPSAGVAAENPGTGQFTVMVAPEDSARLVLLSRRYPTVLTLVPPGYSPTELPPVGLDGALPNSPIDLASLGEDANGAAAEDGEAAVETADAAPATAADVEDE